MAIRIPYNAIPQVAPQGPAAAYQPVQFQAPRNAGEPMAALAGVAQQLGRIGGEALNAADNLQVQQAKLALQAKWNNRLRGQEGQPGYYGLQGVAALQQADGTMEGLQKDLDDIEGGLQPWQRSAFRQRALEELEVERQGIQKHQLTEQKRVQVATLDSMVKSLGDTVVVRPEMPGPADARLAKVRPDGTMENRWASKAWADIERMAVETIPVAEEREKFLAEAKKGVSMRRLQGYLTAGRVPEARGFLDAGKDDFGDQYDNAVKLLGSAEKNAAEDRVGRIADAIIGDVGARLLDENGVPSPDAVARMRNELERTAQVLGAKGQTDVADAIRKRSGDAVANAQASFQAKQESAANSLVAWVEQNGGARAFDKAPAALSNALLRYDSKQYKALRQSYASELNAARTLSSTEAANNFNIYKGQIEVLLHQDPDFLKKMGGGDAKVALRLLMAQFGKPLREGQLSLLEGQMASAQNKASVEFKVAAERFVGLVRSKVKDEKSVPASMMAELGAVSGQYFAQKMMDIDIPPDKVPPETVQGWAEEFAKKYPKYNLGFVGIGATSKALQAIEEAERKKAAKPPAAPTPAPGPTPRPGSTPRPRGQGPVKRINGKLWQKLPDGTIVEVQ